ncbi:MAG: HEAT repeat domain-containing protein [Gemmataceae bacterium]
MKCFLASLILPGLMWVGLAMSASDDGKSPLVVHGKSLAEWGRQLREKDAGKQIAALNAVMAAGPEASSLAPILLDLVADREAGLQHALATLALARMGSAALPALQAALEDRRNGVPQAALSLLSRLGPAARPVLGRVTRQLASPDPTLRRLAAQVLATLGPAGRDAIPSLEKILNDSDAEVRLEVVRALARLGREKGVAATLAGLLNEPPTSVTTAALSQAGDMVGQVKTLEKPVRTLLGASQPEIRLSAAEALFRLTGAAEPGLKVIERSLRSTTQDERLLAIAALGVMKDNDKAMSLISGLLRDKQPQIRREAASSLVGSVALSEDLNNSLIVALTDADPGVGWWSALVLASSPRDLRRLEDQIMRNLQLPLSLTGEEEVNRILDVQRPGRAVIALQQLMISAPTRIQVEAAHLLGIGQVDALPSRETLMKTLETSDGQLRRAVASTLGRMGVEVQPILIKLLASEQERVRQGAAQALGIQGLPARSALPTLLRLLQDPSPGVRTQAAIALWSIEGKPDQPLTVLNQVLKDVDHRDRWEAIEGIGRIGVEARPFIKGITEILVTALKDRDARVRVHAARWLWRRTHQGRVVEPLLQESLADRDPQVRAIAVETLAELPLDERPFAALFRALDDREVQVRLLAELAVSQGGPEVLPHLLEGINSPVARVRAGTLWAVARLGPSARSIRERVEKLIRDPDTRVQLAARVALLRMRPDSE